MFDKSSSQALLTRSFDLRQLATLKKRMRNFLKFVLHRIRKSLLRLLFRLIAFERTTHIPYSSINFTP